VTGVEYAPQAIIEFFNEHKLEYDVTEIDKYKVYKVNYKYIINVFICLYFVGKNSRNSNYSRRLFRNARVSITLYLK
jgi:hypothetical protein